MLKDVLIKFAKDLFFPAFCMDCGAEGYFVCQKCFESLQRNTDRAFFRPAENTALNGISAVFNYEDRSLPARLIHAFKYDLIKELEDPLGRIMGEQVSLLIKNGGEFWKDDPPVLCPVPLHKRREKWRGFNQSRLLARKAAQIAGLEVINPLVRVHFRSPQMALDRGDRARNIEGAFKINTNERALCNFLPFESVFLVDDVATTLSTLNECALTLKEAGYKKVYAIVLARVA